MDQRSGFIIPQHFLKILISQVGKLVTFCGAQEP